MKKHRKRAGIIAHRNAIAVKKRVQLRTAGSRTDRSVIRVNLNEDQKVIINSLSDLNNDVPSRSRSRDSMLSSLTPSTSSLGEDSLPSTSAYSNCEQTTKIEEDPQIVTNLPANDGDIFRILPDLRADFLDANKDQNKNIITPLIEGVTSMFSQQSLEDIMQQKLHSHLAKANDFLWLGDVCNAELEYQEAIEKCKICEDLVLVTHVFNAYGSFLSACLKNHKRATIVLSEALELKKPATKRKLDLSRAVTFTSLGKVYVRRSLETGIKDEGMKNLKRADVCFSSALDIYLSYDKTTKTAQVVQFMTRSMNFRTGDERTLWNEAIAIEAAYDEDDTTVSGDDGSSQFGSASYNEDCGDQCKVFEDDYYEQEMPNFCGWRMCFTIHREDEPRPVMDVNFLKDHYEKEDGRLVSLY